jgi:hypothetical protein
MRCIYAMKVKCDHCKIEASEHSLKTHFMQYKERLQHLNKEIWQTQQNHVLATMTEHLDQHKQQLNSMLDEMVNDIYIVGENIQSSINRTGQDAINDINKTQSILQTLEQFHNELPMINQMFDATKLSHNPSHQVKSTAFPTPNASSELPVDDGKM